MRLPHATIIATFPLFHVALGAFSPSSPFLVHTFARTLELGGSVARSQSTWTIEYKGARVVEPVQFELALPFEVVYNLSWLEAAVGKGSKARILAVTSGNYDALSNARAYSVELPSDVLAPLTNITIVVSELYTHLSVPKPKSLPQISDGQYMLWSGDLLGGAGLKHNLSDVKVWIKTPTPNIKDHSSPDTFDVTRSSGSSTLIYSAKGPTEGAHVASVHYEQPEPVIGLRTLVRSIEVSHWGGNLAFEDRMAIVNDGPELKGYFSRVDHQTQSYLRRTESMAHVLTGLSITLPPNVFAPYYTDIVGNVSTSHFRQSRPSKAGKKKEGSLLEIRPRYPLMGGWRYNCSIGYSAPLGDFLRSEGKGYVLAVPFLTPLKGIATDSVELRIVLPEGATAIRVQPPFPVEAALQTMTHNWLDSTGRPTIILRKTACSEAHGLDVLVFYQLSAVRMLQKPMAIAGVAFGAFLLGAVLRRVDWQIGKGGHKLE